MKHRKEFRERIAFSTWVSVLLAPLSGHADGAADKKTCVAAYEQSQEQRQQGHLRQARERLLTCARAACPGTIVSDCTRWLDDVSSSMPSVVVATVDDQGREVNGGRVLLDGQPFLDKLDGRAREVDPGSHTFRYEPTQGAATEQQVVIREGEKNRTLLFVLAGPAADPKTNQARASLDTVSLATPSHDARAAGSNVPVVAYVAAGVSVVGFGVFGFEALSGKSDQNHLKETCSPRCSPEQTDAVARKYLIADIGLGVGLVGLGAATWLVLSHKPSTSAPQRRWGATPLANGGGYVSYGRNF